MAHYPPPAGYPPGGYGPAGGYAPPGYGADPRSSPYGAPPPGQPEYSPPPPGYEQAPPAGYAPPASADPYAAYGGYDNYMRQYGGQPPPAASSYPPPGPEASAYPPPGASYPPPGAPGYPPPGPGYPPPDPGYPPPPAGSYPPPAGYPPPDPFGYPYGAPPPGYGAPPPGPPGYGPPPPGYPGYPGYGAPPPGYGPPPPGHSTSRGPSPPRRRNQDRGGKKNQERRNNNQQQHQQQQPRSLPEPEPKKPKESTLDPNDPLYRIKKWQRAHQGWVGVWLEGIDPPRKPIATPNVTVLLVANTSKKSGDFGFVLTTSRQAPKRKDREKECIKDTELSINQLPLEEGMKAWCQLPPADYKAPEDGLEKLTEAAQEKVPGVTLEIGEQQAFVVVTASAFAEKTGSELELPILDKFDAGFGDLLKEARRVSGLVRKQWFISIIWAKPELADDVRPFPLGMGLAADKAVARQRAIFSAETRVAILKDSWFKKDVPEKKLPGEKD
eukprot:TRINITY_DN13964_c0_g1_i1.p1 TRINITY_DN13964_c0_g1~~TRINITY_DN13964_c0_g1_i1.p1  ORF type:complete len:498 (-),score=97.79 TRINITY_DN13964_c0_g1_i1:103-1596(-)